MESEEQTEAAARASWAWSERAIRFAATLMRLDQLDKLAELLPRNDRIDIAGEVYRDYIDGYRAADLTKPVDGHTLANQASVLLRCAKYLGEDQVVAFARETWGHRTFEVHVDDDTHLAWYPGDDAIILTRTEMGVRTVMVLTPGHISGRVL